MFKASSVVIIATLLSIGCAHAESTVTLAADPWCPHTCEVGSDSPGYMIEIASRAFATQGYRVIYKNFSWTRVMAEVRDGKLDGAVGALAGEARDLVLPTEPAGRQVNTFAIRQDDPWQFNGLESLKGRVIAINQDYSYAEDLDAWLAKKPTQIQALGGENALERNLKKLTSKRVDVVIEDQAVLSYVVKAQKNQPKIRTNGTYPGGDLFIAFTATGGSGRHLAQIYDAGIRQLRDSGEFQRILTKYGVMDWKTGP